MGTHKIQFSAREGGEPAWLSSNLLSHFQSFFAGLNQCGDALINGWSVFFLLTNITSEKRILWSRFDITAFSPNIIV
jgi:hypothetical protein